MTVAELNDRITRVLAAALGVAIVVAVVLMVRPAGGHGGVLPASLRFAASQDGAVAVSPAAPRSLLEAAHLRPGDSIAGALVLRNQTGERLPVRLRAEPSSTILDGITRVRIEAAGETVFDSTLQALREGSDPIRIAPGGAVRARVLVWIPANEATGYEGRHVDVTLVPTEGAGSVSFVAAHPYLRRVSLFALWLGLGVLFAALIAAAGPLALGDRSFTMRSGSMTPAIDTGDVVVTEPISPLTAKVGDIVTFRDPEGSGKLFSHRVQAIRPVGEDVRFVTRGDANTATEHWNVPAGGSVGKVLYTVPKIGYALMWTDTVPARIALIVIPALLLCWTGLKRIWRPQPEPEVSPGE